MVVKLVMRVLLTGGAGFIGSHVAEGLVARGHTVCVFDDLSTGRRENVPEGADFIVGDIRDEGALRSALASFRPDMINHHAAQVSVSRSTREPELDAAVNIVGTLTLVKCALAAGVGRVVFASTGGAIYGEVPAGTRATVEWAPQPASPYACSKLAAETYLRAYGQSHGLDSTILRYANVYGERQDPHGEAGVVAIFSQRLLAGRPIVVYGQRSPGDEGCVRDYVYVGDVVRANVLATEGRIEGPIVNVCTGRPTTTRELALLIAAETEHDANILDEPPRAGDLERSLLEPDPALGSPLRLEEGLHETVQWFAANRAGS